MSDIGKKFLLFITELESEGVVDKSKISGWSEQQIENIESLFKIKLPLLYHLFITSLGENADLFIDRNEYCYDYESVIEMNEYVKEYLASVVEEGYDLDSIFFPRNSLIILGRYSTVFYFIVCDNQEDSKVYCFDTDEFAIKEVCESLFEYFDWLRVQAKNGIDAGYRVRT